MDEIHVYDRFVSSNPFVKVQLNDKRNHSTFYVICLNDDDKSITTASTYIKDQLRFSMRMLVHVSQTNLHRVVRLLDMIGPSRITHTNSRLLRDYITCCKSKPKKKVKEQKLKQLKASSLIVPTRYAKRIQGTFDVEKSNTLLLKYDSKDDIFIEKPIKRKQKFVIYIDESERNHSFSFFTKNEAHAKSLMTLAARMRWDIVRMPDWERSEHESLPLASIFECPIEDHMLHIMVPTKSSKRDVMNVMLALKVVSNLNFLRAQ